MTNTTQNDLVLAGSTYGSGALTGWNGLGTLARHEIITALSIAFDDIDTDLPVDWVPRSKSAIGYAGQVLGALRNRGYIVRRAKAARWENKEKTVRAYRARWIVAATNTAAEVGEAAGNVVLTAELHDNMDTLLMDGNSDLREIVFTEYARLRDAEELTAGDITNWLKSILITECGAARYAMGYYVPAEGRGLASLLVDTVSRIWGCNWAAPMLPVATNDELKTGIARSFYDEVFALEIDITDAEKDAQERGKDTVSPTKATGFLRRLADFASRVEPYTALCGADAMANVNVIVHEVRAKLEPLAHSGVVRFSNLELNDSPVVPSGDVHVPPVVATTERDTVPMRPLEIEPEPMVATIDEVLTKALAPNATDERFSMLELD